MDNRPVFALITAEDCPHCKNFRKNDWNDIKSALLAQNKVRVHDIEVPHVGATISGEYPSDINRFARWYPTFVLIEGKSWNAGKKLSGLVFNGNISAGGAASYDRANSKSPTKENLLRWVDTESSQLASVNIAAADISVGAVSKGAKQYIPTSCSKHKFRAKNK